MEIKQLTRSEVIPMKKNAYRAKNINQISAERLLEKLPAGRTVVAIDVAKHEFAVAFAGADGAVVEYVKFTHPIQTGQFLELLEAVGCHRTLEAVMEPTGTYGDAVRGQLLARGIAVFAVSPKRCHDAAEIFDGVPSLHDAKAAAILARLHLQKLSRPWPLDEEMRRKLRAAVSRRELYAAPLAADQGRLEALLARHWPEFSDHLDTNTCKSSLALLAEYPGPEALADATDAATDLMVRCSRGRLSAQTIANVVSSARGSLGVPMLPQERKLLSELARQMIGLRAEIDRVEEEIAELAQGHEEIRHLSATIGKVTAVVLVSMLGSATSYPSAGAYVKAMGLNLKESSSGQTKKPGTGLHITKRGPGLVRRYLFMAVLRLVQKDPIAKAWYERRGAYGRNEKLKAVVAMMRKLARGLWHVGRGAQFDAAKLFDTRRLGLAPAQPING